MKGLAWALGGGTVLATLVLGVILADRLLDEPTWTPPDEPTTPSLAAGLPEGLAELLLRQAGLSRRNDPIVVSAAALSDFLARHLETRRSPVRPRGLRVGSGWVELLGRSSPRQLLARAPASLLPDAILDLDLWLVLRGRVVLRDGHGELAVEETAIGRQRVPAAWVSRALRTAPGELLTWRMPRIVERVELEPGRLVLHTRRPGT